MKQQYFWKNFSFKKSRAWKIILFEMLSIPFALAGQNIQNADTSLFYDSHFHLTNYIQEGIDIKRFVEIMGTKVGRSTVFGIPLQQQWSYENTGDFAPTYYLASDAPLYY